MKFWGRSSDSPADKVSALVQEMQTPKPLPIGKAEFEIWSDRIIAGTCLPAEPSSQKFALCQMLLHLPPTQDHECDGYFIKSLRKAAINQVADAMATEIRDARKKQAEDAAQQKLSASDESKKQ